MGRVLGVCSLMARLIEEARFAEEERSVMASMLRKSVWTAFKCCTSSRG